MFEITMWLRVMITDLIQPLSLGSAGGQPHTANALIHTYIHVLRLNVAAYWTKGKQDFAQRHPSYDDANE